MKVGSLQANIDAHLPAAARPLALHDLSPVGYLPAAIQPVLRSVAPALYNLSSACWADHDVLCLQAFCVAAVLAVCLGVACAQPFAPGQGFLPSGRTAFRSSFAPLFL